jgi:hypothetical protein
MPQGLESRISDCGDQEGDGILRIQYSNGLSDGGEKIAWHRWDEI